MRRPATRIGETSQVNDEDGPTRPSADEPSGGSRVETTDLALGVPLAAIPVLALVLSAALWWAFGTDRLLVSLVPFAVLLAAITVIDLRELRVPNRILQPAAIVAVPLLVIASTSNWPDLSLVRVLLGAAVYGGLYFVVLLIYPPGMGWGDVKLAPLLGAQLGLFGWIPLVRSIVIAHVVSGLVAVVIVVVGAASRGRLKGKIAFPFAPFMAIGAIAALVLEGVG